MFRGFPSRWNKSGAGGASNAQGVANVGADEAAGSKVGKPTSGTLGATKDVKNMTDNTQLVGSANTVTTLANPGSRPGSNPSSPQGSTMGKSQRDQIAWSNDERQEYVAALNILSLPGEEPVMRFLADALQQSPLPEPWVMHRDQKGRVFFANQTTGESSWNHPLESSLRELAGVCRVCLTLPSTLRESCISTLHKTWEAEAKTEFSKWYAVSHPESGREYYCHRDTNETMWEHPTKVILPAHFLKLKSIERLRDDRYLAEIGSLDSATLQKMTQMQLTGEQVPGAGSSTPSTPAASTGAPNVVLTLPEGAAASGAAQQQQQGTAAPSAGGADGTHEDLLAMKRDLEEQLRGVSASKEKLEQELQRAENELYQAKAAGTETALRATQTEAELEQERRRCELAQQECSQLAVGRQEAEESMLEAQRTKNDLESKLEQLASGAALTGDNVANLMKSLQVEQERTAELQRTNTGLDSTWRMLEAQLSEESAVKGAIQEDLSRAHGEISIHRDKAVEAAELAERTRADLEARIERLASEHREKEAVLAAERDECIGGLQKALEEEQGRRAEFERANLELHGNKDRLEMQLSDAATARESLQKELSKAEANMWSEKDSSVQIRNRFLQIEAELAEESRQAKSSEAALAELSEAKARALANVQEAERSNAAMQARMLEVEQSYRAENEDRIAKLTEELLAEQEQRAQLLESHGDVNGRRSALEDELKEASMSRRALRTELLDAEAALQAAKVDGDGVREKAIHAEAELLEERRRAEHAEEECAVYARAAAQATSALKDSELRAGGVPRAPHLGAGTAVSDGITFDDYAAEPRPEEDSRNEKEDKCELTFSEVPFEGLDHDAFKAELLTNLRSLGAKDTTLSKFKIDLRAGSTIAEVRGPCSAMNDLKDLPLADVEVMGSRAKITSGFHAAERSLAPIPEHQAFKVQIVGARDLRDGDWFSGASDAYVVCEILDKPKSRVETGVLKDANPVWNYEAEFPGYAAGDSLSFTVYDKDAFKDDVLGKCVLESSQFHPAGFEGELRLDTPGKKGQKSYLAVRIAAGPTPQQSEDYKKALARVQEVDSTKQALETRLAEVERGLKMKEVARPPRAGLAEKHEHRAELQRGLEKQLREASAARGAWEEELAKKEGELAGPGEAPALDDELSSRKFKPVRQEAPPVVQASRHHAPAHAPKAPLRQQARKGGNVEPSESRRRIATAKKGFAQEGKLAMGALEDAVLLAHRIWLLRAEGEKTRRQIRETEEKTHAIVKLRPLNFRRLAKEAEREPELSAAYAVRAKLSTTKKDMAYLNAKLKEELHAVKRERASLLNQRESMKQSLPAH